MLKIVMQPVGSFMVMARDSKDLYEGIVCSWVLRLSRKRNPRPPQDDWSRELEDELWVSGVDREIRNRDV
jgi:hypothetical protein